MTEPKKGAAQGLWRSVWGRDCGQSMACASRTAGHSQGASEAEEWPWASQVALKIADCVGERARNDDPASNRGAKKLWREKGGHVARGSRIKIKGFGAIQDTFHCETPAEEASSAVNTRSPSK